MTFQPGGWRLAASLGAYLLFTAACLAIAVAEGNVVMTAVGGLFLVGWLLLVVMALVTRVHLDAGVLRTRTLRGSHAHRRGEWRAEVLTTPLPRGGVERTLLLQARAPKREIGIPLRLFRPRDREELVHAVQGALGGAQPLGLPADAPAPLRDLADELLAAGLTCTEETEPWEATYVLRLGWGRLMVVIAADGDEWWLGLGSAAPDDWFPPSAWARVLDGAEADDEVAWTRQRWRDVAFALEQPIVVDAVRDWSARAG